MSEPDKPIGAIDLAEGVWATRRDLRYAFSRSGGPGGQAVNKLATKAELRVEVGRIVGLSGAACRRLRTLAGRRLTRDDELVLVATGTRSQLENKRACLARLRALVADARKVPRKRKPTRPTRAAKEKRLAQKRVVAKKKEARRKPGGERE